MFLPCQMIQTHLTISSVLRTKGMSFCPMSQVNIYKPLLSSVLSLSKIIPEVSSCHMNIKASVLSWFYIGVQCT